MRDTFSMMVHWYTLIEERNINVEGPACVYPACHHAPALGGGAEGGGQEGVGQRRERNAAPQCRPQLQTRGSTWIWICLKWAPKAPSPLLNCMSLTPSSPPSLSLGLSPSTPPPGPPPPFDQPGHLLKRTFSPGSKGSVFV